MIYNILEQVLLGNRVSTYAIFVSILLLGIAAVKIFKIIFLRKFKEWAKKTVTTLDDFIVNIFEKIGVPILYFTLFYLSVKVLTLSPFLDKIVNVLAMAAYISFIVRLFVEVINYSFEIYWKKTRQTETFEHSLSGALVIVKFAIWSFAAIFFLDNLGFKISTVIAGLGIGGVAIALAAQAVLKDLFSYFSIIFDRPFEVGDFIIVGDLLGTIEHIGIKTTRIRSLGGEQLIFSNSDLTDSRLRNYKRMQQRRVVFKLGVTYNTPLDKLKDIPGIIENTIKSIKDTRFDRAHFFSYGDFSLIFEIVYYVLGGDYNKYMDVQQEINFILKEEFEKRDMQFAFPTQTLYLAK